MHAYLLTLEVSPLQVGQTYDMIPLHCTLVHWFWLEQSPEEVAKRLQVRLQSQKSITLTAQDEQAFTGKTKQGATIPVTVNDIVATPELRQLHEDMCQELEAMGVQYSEPQYVHEGFRPHVTHQKDGKLTSGEVRTSGNIYLIEAAAPEYGNDRTVQATLKLS